MPALAVRVLAVALVCAAAPRPAAAQDTRVRGSAPPAPAIPNGYLGYTFCRSGLAESWVRADIVGTPQAEEVLAHEAVHRAQAAAFPTCEAYYASLRSARAIIDAEVPAYCAQFTVAVRHGADPAKTLVDYGLRIAAQSGAMENRLELIERVKRECGGAEGAASRGTTDWH